MFKSALVKLTGLYLMILMVVSVLFSFSLYKISTDEVNNRLRRQADFVSGQVEIGGGISVGPGPDSVRTFNLLPLEQRRIDELTDTKRHILIQLLYANMLVLFLGGAGSYFLAKRTLKQIEESHEAQTRFVADASHELRTPIATMRAETEVALRDKKLSIKEARELLASNIEELDRLGTLSQGLLQLARGIQTDGLQESVEIPEIVKNAVQQVAHQAAAKNITIKAEDIPKSEVVGNKIQLVQLLVILLDNAIKYSEPQQLITINGSLQHNNIRLRITDQGSGIKATHLPHIFERFYRADSARSSQKVSGNGLGLAIAKQIVEAHQGTIHVTSTPGEGSIFTVLLPLK